MTTNREYAVRIWCKRSVPVFLRDDKALVMRGERAPIKRFLTVKEAIAAANDSDLVRVNRREYVIVRAEEADLIEFMEDHLNHV